jgi:membrane associated rhomboid family serine protease
VFPLKDNVPTRSFPVVTVALIAINFAVWIFYQLPDLNGSVAQLAYQPCEVVSSCPAGSATGASWEVTWLTSMFMHGSWLHIIGNMLFLWIFGNNVEDALGRGKFLAFYVACGVAAAAAQVFATVLGGDERALLVPMVGASGAIAGVLAGYMVLFPHARVLTFIPIFLGLVYLPASLYLGLWFLTQLASAVLGDTGGGVAFMAHVGGFIAGWILVKTLGPRTYRARRVLW